MATGTNQIDYPTDIKIRTTETHKEQARAITRAKGYKSVSEMLRAYIETEARNLKTAHEASQQYQAQSLTTLRELAQN